VTISFSRDTYSLEKLSVPNILVVYSIYDCRIDKTMAVEVQEGNGTSRPRKKLLLNAFDMFTPSHLAFGQWANPRDRSKDKRRDLSYWTDLAKTLEKGSFVGYFLADTYGPYDV
jgi:hypothetical protein